MAIEYGAEYVTLPASVQQQWLCERASFLAMAMRTLLALL
jgi:hypothetical protein